ncbi:hypothetical protein DCCM_0722 [Desulfocucumis palustris]|uniref:Uncharacterized protein n=1 Tax=Desulfocucumis palustris TaxID=1898651 RepID=A0A2L2XE66_9FIRM|nr:hypothetical protein DCCM_0722 [Desulfocucumis palustris]
MSQKQYDASRDFIPTSRFSTISTMPIPLAPPSLFSDSNQV